MKTEIEALKERVEREERRGLIHISIYASNTVAKTVEEFAKDVNRFLDSPIIDDASFA